MTEAFAGAPPLGETPEHETTTIGCWFGLLRFDTNE